MELDIRSRLQEECGITVADTKELIDFESYGSMGMISTLIDILAMLHTRITRGDVIMNDEDGKVFTEESYKAYVKKHFSSYVVKELYKETRLASDVYFKLKNTESGLDLIYNDDHPNKVFKWIANIDENYSLVYLRFNHVVYIQNRRTLNVTVMYSEHNNCYTYDEKLGKIIEAF